MSAGGVRPATLYAMAGALAVALAAGALGVRFGPALALSLALVAPSTEAWLAPAPAEVAREAIAIGAGPSPLRADLYRPGRSRGALLLVHGLSPLGRRHPELERLARRLARHGVAVLVPHFEGLAAFRLSGREVEEIRGALRHLDSLDLPTAVAGLSFGAGPALLAAAEHPGLRLAASFGGYADLRHVIGYVTTGAHSFGGRRHVQRQEEYNRWKLLTLLTGFVEDDRDRGLLGEIAARRLADPGSDTHPLEEALGREGRSIRALVLNRREEDVGPLLAALPRGAREALDRLSPLAAVPRLAGRLLIAHGAGDPSIPFTESLRLAEAVGGRARLVILESFHHTGPEPFWPSLLARARDAWGLVSLADALLVPG